MSVLHNVSRTEIRYEEFTKWVLAHQYAFIWNGELHRFSDTGEGVMCWCTGEIYEENFFVGEIITPVEVVKINYKTVGHQ